MIDIKQFAEIIWGEFRTGFERNGYVSSADVPHDLDVLGAGILDSMDLLTLSLALDDVHGLTMDFSKFSGQFEGTITGLYSSLEENVKGMAPAGKNLMISLIISGLCKAGLGKDDVVFIHSSMMGMGVDDHEKLYKELRGLIGDGGTILVPAANPDAFLDGEFDIKKTPVHPEMGSFSEYLRSLPYAVRSGNAFDSVVGVGPMAEEICGQNNTVCYGEGSPWQKMLGKDVKLLMLGVNFYYASIVHAAELECKVPYRSWKTFANTIVKEGAEVDFSIELYAMELNSKRYYDKLFDLPKIKEQTYVFEGKDAVYLISLNTLYEEAVKILRQSPRFFV